MSAIELLPPIDKPMPVAALRTLAPAGLGTGMVESLSSYLRRLAALHRVTPLQLERLVNERDDARASQPLQWDAPTGAAREFARRLAVLVRQPAVEFLGLGWMEQDWAPPQTLKAAPAWCPTCLAEMPTPYMPLAWSLKTYTVCSRHHVQLRDTCCNCGRRQSSTGRDHVHLCTNCGCGLAGGGPSMGEEAWTPPVRSDVSSLTMELIEDLQTRCPGQTPHLDLAAAIQSAIRAGHVESYAELGRLAGIGRETLHRCDTEATNPTLEVILRLCVAGKIPPGATVGLRRLGDTESRATTASSTFIPAARRSMRHDWDAIAKAMFEAMADLDKVPSVAEFAARYDVSPNALRRRLSGMTEALSKLSQQRQAREADRKAAALVERIRVSAQQLAGSGLRPTTQRIAEAVQLRVDSNAFRAAMRRYKARSVGVAT